MPGDAPPLAAHELFRSTDLDEARDRVAQVFCPHRLDIVGRGEAAFDARQHFLKGERLSLSYIEYGAKTLIAPGLLERFYLVQIPVAGCASIANGADEYCSCPDRAAVLNPHLPTTMIWEAGTRQVLVQIERRALADHLAALTGLPADRPITFTGALDLTTPQGAALHRLVLHLLAEADAGRSPLGPGLLAQSVEAAVMSGLLDAHRHDHAAQLGRVGVRGPRPRQLRLAESYIEAHLDQPLTLEAVAAAAGVSARALQLAFRRHRNTTPLGWWRERRLMRAHAELIAGGASVTEVALRWGFEHLGRFAEAYRARYGVTPREALRAARAEDCHD